ncbi:MAG: hypothetical protein HRU01_30275 [Myxococcales bacterium]|nr:hypothetical protein [Myxococcales bacterium]
MASAGARIGIVGATGSLGGEVLGDLSRSTLRVREIVPIATDDSLGEEIDFQDELYPVVAAEPDAPELASLRGLDLVILCAPPAASLEYARQALRVEVPCIDASGALAASDEVPLHVAALDEPGASAAQPLLAAPAGAALPWALVLKPLQAAVGLRRVVGTVLDAVSAVGTRGVEVLHGESVAVFNQAEMPEPELFGKSVAFDCLPATRASGAFEPDGSTTREKSLVSVLGRLLGHDVGIGATCVQVPSFLGQASVLSVETLRPIDVKQAEDWLASAPGVHVWTQDAEGPSMRASAGHREALVGRVRRDESTENALSLWISADVIALAAANAVDLAVARLQLS